MSSDLNNVDLVKYLNYKILQKYPQVANYLAIKNNMTNDFDTLEDLDHKRVDLLCSYLEKDDQINLEVLLGE